MMPLVAFAKNYDAEVASTTTSITVQGNTLIKKVNYVIKVNNRDGDDYTAVTISYDKGEDFSHLEARILDKNGTVVRKLKEKDVIKEYGSGEDALFQDTYQVAFQLDYNEYPYTLVYSYQVKSQDPLTFAEWVPVFGRNIPTLKAKLIVEIPKNYLINYRSQRTDTLIKSSDGDDLKYTWKAHFTKLLDKEAFAPPLNEIVPGVIVVPKYFDYGGSGSFASWRAFGNWQDYAIKGLDVLPESEKSKIRSLVKGISDTTQIIRILYHYLQDETRYINVVIKTGRYIPYPASYVAKNKYGDCKALSNYMKAMLKYVGIKSFYTVIRGGDNIIKFDTNFVSPYPFNHVILYVPNNGKPLWLDCTSKYAFGWLGSFDQGRYAMVVQKNNTRLIRTPSLTPKQVEELRMINVSYNLNGEVELNFENTYRGDMYEELDGFEREGDPMYKQQAIRNYVASQGFNLMSDSIHQFNRDSTDIQLFFTARSGQIYNQYGNDLLVQNIPFQVPDVENPEDRKLPLQINYPVYRVDSIHYEMPPGFKLDAVVKDTVLTTKFGKYSHRWYKRGDAIYVTNRLLIHAGNYPLKVYNKFYQFLKEAGNDENSVAFSLTKETP